MRTMYLAVAILVTMVATAAPTKKSIHYWELIDEVTKKFEGKAIVCMSVAAGERGKSLSEQASNLASFLPEASNKKLYIVVFGPPSAEVRHVVLEALRLTKSNDLRGMCLVFCGAENDRDVVREKVLAKGALFEFYEFND